MSGLNAIAPLLKPILGIVVALVGLAPDVCAQSPPRTNVEILGDLAVECVGDTPDTLSSFLLEESDRMPYLRPRLSEYWRDLGKQVFLADTAAGFRPPSDLHRLGYTPEEASVVYSKAEASRLSREISLAIRYRLLAPSGLLVDEGRCRERHADTIIRDDIPLVERDPFPETHGQPPPEGSWRDWAEPVALGAAVGIVAYLFFTVRSSS